MDERHGINSSLSGSSGPGLHDSTVGQGTNEEGPGIPTPGAPGPDAEGFGATSGSAGNGAPTGWSAPEGYWGASSQTGWPSEALPQDQEWSQRTLHDRNDWVSGPSTNGHGASGPYAASSQLGTDPSVSTNQQDRPQDGQYPASGQYPQGGQYPPPGQYPQGSVPQSDWDAWYSSFGGGQPPQDPDYAQGGQGGQRPPKRGLGRRIAAIVALCALIIVAAAAVIVPNAQRSGLWPTSSSSSSSQGGYQPITSPEQGGDEPSSGQVGSGQTSAQTQTNATTAQSKGVVLIETTTTSGSAAGTGMVLSADGYVLTNYHVVESSTAIKVTLASSSKSYSATVVGHDATNDVALLKLSGASGLSTVSFDNDGVKLGEKVTAVGNSQGQGYLSAAGGSITSTSATVTVSSELASSGSETLKDVYQTDAQAVPGDSGGPMFDAEDEVVGITTAGEQSDSGTTGQTSTVASWAIPISRALSIVDEIEAGNESGTVQIGPKAYLGVTVQSARGGGLVIAQVVNGGPADQAGLSVGDAVTAINGNQLTSQSDLSEALDQLQPGNKASLTVIDPTTGDASTVVVTLGSSPIN